MHKWLIISDPILTSTNFIKALERIPALIEKYQSENQKLKKDLPVLKEAMTATWKKEPELKDLKSQLDSLSRQINLSLENKNQELITNTTIPERKPELSTSKINSEEPDRHSGKILSIKDIIDANPDRIIIAKPDTGNQNKSRGIKI
ncbi:hypothetical protein KL86DYS2_11729 [uncultured Dysgonomonas sp.]|uniref:Uncharacterized protein n=1 Tax=uncultured Dysgonomonas sp. TaxID=206096 RepID=A0A212JK09_9BACT|nr:hypothetical protein [uncultured Dysgonomonas sp.]SBV99757.1 hypothetical protein KL86DYS2_11729 [uncultured Dysgonomonas sp.]